MVKKRTISDKIMLFSTLFHGNKTAYGKYEPESEKYRQVKESVEENVIYSHLKGICPYGLYPLEENITYVGVVDLDTPDPEKPVMFYNRARHYELPAYIERSKSKGWHVWMFFNDEGVKAWKVRVIMQMLLDEIESPKAEIFPKQDAVDVTSGYGNFINAPLFGKLVLEMKTVFVNPKTLKPYPDQWGLLESIQKIDKIILDEIIEINDLCKINDTSSFDTGQGKSSFQIYALPACIRRILEKGATYNQRIACFRIAVHLRRIGIPFDVAAMILLECSRLNKPVNGKRIITPEEVVSQARDGYKEKYTGYGCNVTVIRDFCDPECPVKNKVNTVSRTY